VTIIPYAARSSPPSMPAARRLAAFRLVLEEFAVRECIAHASELDYARITNEIEKLRKRARTGNVSATLEADLHVHQTIVSCANNPFSSERMPNSSVISGFTQR